MTCPHGVSEDESCRPCKRGSTNEEIMAIVDDNQREADRAREADAIVRALGNDPLATSLAWGAYARCIWCREQAPFAKDIKHADGCVVARARAYAKDPA